MTDVLLVGLGGDIGVYAFFRAAHERFGWKPLMLARTTTTFLRYSTLPSWRIEPDIHEPEVLIDRLNAIAADHPDHQLLVFTNLDWHVGVLARYRDRLDPRWLVPFCDLDTFERVSSKSGFAQACAAVGVRTPTTITVRFGSAARHGDGVDVHSATADSVVQAVADAGLRYPLIGKPATSADWFRASFPGKQKIHHLESPEDLQRTVSAIEAIDYPGEFLVQEFIPGDETHMRSLTAYRDRRGEVTLVAGGQVLLEEHTPGTLGIPAAILTQTDTEAFDAARRILDHTDYYGFANLDYKVSSATGERVFFEMNPRIGRNNYYVTAAGVNVAQVVANDLLPDLASQDEPAQPEREVLYSVVSLRLLRRYLTDPSLRSHVAALKRRGAMVHPLVYSGDRSLKRRLYVKALNLRLALKYRQYYPRPTESGF